ncbi:MAG: hypothetical protein RL203_280 [Pseudomonadota bacterium]|jgi:hypothetical protein
MGNGVTAILLAGVIACLAMDVWQQILKRMSGIPATNWAIVGRWFVLTLRRGTMYHPSIDNESSVANELLFGWIVHYFVSMMYAIIYLVLMIDRVIEPTLADGFLFGAFSVVVPWFYFMPCMGKGVMAKLTPNPKKACLISLSSHLVFGTAMGLGFLFAQSI